MADTKQLNPYDTVTLGDAPITSVDQSAIENSPYSGINYEKPAPNSKASVTVTGVPADYMMPTLLGGAAGAAAAKYGPQPYNLSPEFIKDQEALRGKITAQNTASNLLNDVQTLHAGSFGDAQDIHNTKLNALKNAEDMFAQATEYATKLDAIPPEGAGQKWIPTSAATGTPIGAAETTVSEAGQLSRLAANRPVGYGLTNAGIYVPGTGDAPAILTKEQELAKANALKNYLAAQALRDQHQKIAEKSAAELERLKKSVPSRSTSLQKRLDDLAVERAEIEARLQSRTPSPNAIQRLLSEKIPYAEETMNALGKANEFVNKTPGLKYALPTASAGLGAAQTMSGMESYGKGDRIKGALEMLSGTGGMIGAFPHPATRAAGALAQVPYMGYEAVDYLRNKFYPPK